jgi:hypothetical protein
MGVHSHHGTMEGGLTPICESCGISLCWDIARCEYLDARAFWDAWKCQDCNGSRLSAHGWRLENGLEALAPAIREAMDAFWAANPGYANPDGARGRSLEASDGLRAALAAIGVEAIPTVIATVAGTPHHGLTVGDFTVDWTAVQHDDDAPCPLVFRSTLAWPIEPEGASDLSLILAEMGEDRRARLLERLRSLEPEEAAC